MPEMKDNCNLFLETCGHALRHRSLYPDQRPDKEGMAFIVFSIRSAP
jgi:hypothetical protein